MFSRTLNAVRDIFELSETSGSELSGFVTECVWELTRRLGADVGTDMAKLEEAIEKVGQILEKWTEDSSGSNTGGSFRARMVTAMTTGFTIRGSRAQTAPKLKELEADESVHARRLMIPTVGSDVRRGAIFVLISMFIRTAGDVDKKRIEKILDEWFPNTADTDAHVCEMRRTIELMLDDGGDNSGSNSCI